MATFQDFDDLGDSSSMAATAADIEAPSAATAKPSSPKRFQSVPAPPASEAPVTGRIRQVPILDRARNAKRDNTAAANETRVQASYPIMKPPRSKFVRVHPESGYRLPRILTYTDQDTSDVYYVDPLLELPTSIEPYVRMTNLYAAQTHDRDLQLRS